MRRSYDVANFLVIGAAKGGTTALHRYLKQHPHTLDFADAPAAEDQRVADKYGHRWYYLRRGFYAAQLRPYFANFRREQLKVYLAG